MNIIQGIYTTILYTRITTFWDDNMNIKWTEDEKEYIRNNAATMKDVEIADELTIMSGRCVTLDAVRKVRQKLGIMKKPGRGVCALVYSPPEEAKADLSNWENESDSL